MSAPRQRELNASKRLCAQHLTKGLHALSVGVLSQSPVLASKPFLTVAWAATAWAGTGERRKPLTKAEEDLFIHFSPTSSLLGRDAALGALRNSSKIRDTGVRKQVNCECLEELVRVWMLCETVSCRPAGDSDLTDTVRGVRIKLGFFLVFFPVYHNNLWATQSLAEPVTGREMCFDTPPSQACPENTS